MNTLTKRSGVPDQLGVYTFVTLGILVKLNSSGLYNKTFTIVNYDRSRLWHHLLTTIES